MTRRERKERPLSMLQEHAQAKRIELTDLIGDRFTLMLLPDGDPADLVATVAVLMHNQQATFVQGGPRWARMEGRRCHFNGAAIKGEQCTAWVAAGSDWCAKHQAESDPYMERYIGRNPC